MFLACNSFEHFLHIPSLMTIVIINVEYLAVIIQFSKRIKPGHCTHALFKTTTVVSVF